MLRSLRARLFVVWALSLLAALALGFLLLRLDSETAESRRVRADVVAARTCERIADRYGYYDAGWTGPPAAQPLDAEVLRDFAAILALAGSTAGVQAGFWHVGEGIVAASPGAELLSPDERREIAELATAAVDQGTAQRQQPSASSPFVLRAIPLIGPIVGLAAWARVDSGAPSGVNPLRLGLAVLLALVLGIAAWLAWLIADWNRKIRVVEQALAGSDARDLPALPRTGEPSLDRIVAALNTAGRRLSEARADTEAMARRAAMAERLAALGRVAAGVAHEIRNPLAAMRLRAENALHGDASRRAAALEVVLVQIARLDHLLTDLLAMTHSREPKLETVALPAFLAALAGEATLPVATRCDLAAAGFDPALIHRALENLLGNACRHAGPGGHVSLEAGRVAEMLRFTVADSGSGVDPALRASLFEPFVTGRAEGTGLGLAIAREIALAHGGRLVLADPGGEQPGRGAVFALEVPWRAS